MPAARYVRAPDILLESMGEGWAAFSALSSETHLLNNETAAVVETLDPSDALTAFDVAERLADYSGLCPSDMVELLGNTWAMLLEAGLIRLDKGADCCLT